MLHKVVTVFGNSRRVKTKGITGLILDDWDDIAILGKTHACSPAFLFKIVGQRKEREPNTTGAAACLCPFCPFVPSVLCFVCVLCVLLEGLGCRRVVSSWDVSVAWSVARAGASRDRIKNRLCDVAFGPETFD